MSEFEPAGIPSSKNRTRSAARTAWALFGLVALLASGIGAYLSLRPGYEHEPALGTADSGGATVFRVHDAPRAVADFAFVDEHARKRTLAEFRGKVVLLNVWATWCTPCREEMPALDRLQQKLGGTDFEVIALSIDARGATSIRRFYNEVGVRALAIYVDPTLRATGSLGVVGVPTTLVIDRQGREIGRRTGPAQWDAPEAVRKIEGYLRRG